MPTCAQCGEDNPARARYCLACGASVAAPADDGKKKKKEKKAKKESAAGEVN